MLLIGRYRPDILRVVLFFGSLVLLFTTPRCFIKGARLAWKETGRKAKLSRWLNIVGVAVFLGVVVVACISYLTLVTLIRQGEMTHPR